MSLREAAEIALSVLENYSPQHGGPEDMCEAMDALRAALSESAEEDATKAQEPRREVERERDKANMRDVSMQGLEPAQELTDGQYRQALRDIVAVYRNVFPLSEEVNEHQCRILKKAMIHMYAIAASAIVSEQDEDATKAQELSDEDIDEIWWNTVRDVPRDFTNRQIRVACVRAILAAARWNA